jgi:hypothetical protein
MKSTEGISVAARKAKGRNLQKWLREELLYRFPELEPDDIRSTSMGVSGEDLQLSPRARRSIPYSFECKARNKLAIYQFFQQATTNTPKGATTVLLVKQDRSTPLVVLKASDFLEMMQPKAHL